MVDNIATYVDNIGICVDNIGICVDNYRKLWKINSNRLKFSTKMKSSPQ